MFSTKIPFKFRSSDGQFNMESALKYVQALTNRIYIAMNDQISYYKIKRKNTKLGIFEELEVS